MSLRRLLPTPRALHAALACGLGLGVAACSDDDEDPPRARIDFVTSTPAFETIVVDDGPVEVAEGVSMRSVITFEAFWDLEASGTAYRDFIAPIAESGTVSLRGTATMEIYATVTIPGQELDGLVGTQSVDMGVNVANFDPFLLDEPWQLGFDAPNEFQARIDPASGLGLAFVVEASLTPFPTYEGLCLAVDGSGSAAQYTGVLQPLADFKLLYSVESVSPLGNTRLGSLGVDLEWDQIADELGLEVDLGTYSMDDGERLEGSGPCGA